MYRPKLPVAAAAFALTMNSTAQAQVMVDMERITCEQLLRGDQNSVEGAIWLSGYYNGLRKSTVLDINQLKQNAASVMKECSSSPSKTVMETVEALLSQKK